METININGIDYVKKEDVENKQVIEFTGEQTIASTMIGKNVIVRSRNEGINIGTVVVADETGVVIENARRIWYHKPKDKSLSWYEGVAVSGLSDDSKISGTVKQKVIIENYSMVLVEKEAYNQIMELVPNEQN